jgi:hypothetical protein
VRRAVCEVWVAGRGCVGRAVLGVVGPGSLGLVGRGFVRGAVLLAVLGMAAGSPSGVIGERPQGDGIGARRAAVCARASSRWLPARATGCGSGRCPRRLWAQPIRIPRVVGAVVGTAVRFVVVYVK